MLQEPENVFAEYALIKTILDSPEALDMAVSDLEPRMFNNKENATVFETMLRMAEEGIDIDKATLKGYLNSRYKQVGGDDYFTQLDNSDAKGNVERYVQDIRTSAILREIMHAGADIMETAMVAHDTESAIRKFQEHLEKVTSSKAFTSSEAINIGSFVDEQRSELYDRIENPGFRGLKTGIFEYDYGVGGFNPGELVYVAARPSVGKTSLILTILYNQAAMDIPVMLFSYEMSAKRIFNRLLAIDSGIPYTKIVTGNLNTYQQDKINESFARLAGLPFFISDSMTMEPLEITRLASRMITNHGVKVCALDYLQLLCKTDNLNTELGRISRNLKLHAEQEDITWVVASQLNRDVERREDKRPILADLRASGNLEQDADIVMMLFREAVYNSSPENKDIAELLTRKNRNGPTPNFVLGFDETTMKFYSKEQ